MGTFEHARIANSIILRAGVYSVVNFMLFLSKEVKHELKLLLGPVIVCWLLLLDINVGPQISITLISNAVMP